MQHISITFYYGLQKSLMSQQKFYHHPHTALNKNLLISQKMIINTGVIFPLSKIATRQKHLPNLILELSYWSIIKTFHDDKVSPIPNLVLRIWLSLLFKKANIFNFFFAYQYIWVSNNSPFPLKISYLTEKSILLLN